MQVMVPNVPYICTPVSPLDFRTTPNELPLIIVSSQIRIRMFRPLAVMHPHRGQPAIQQATESPHLVSG